MEGLNVEIKKIDIIINMIAQLIVDDIKKKMVN